MRIALLPLLFFLLFSCKNPFFGTSKKIYILPLPFSVEYGSDNGFIMQDSILIVYNGNISDEALLLSEYLKASGIVCKIKTSDKKEKGCIFLSKGIGADSVESYKLLSRRDELVVLAPSRFGILHGIQSIRQLFLREYKGEGSQLAAFEINDTPKFRWRGMLLDCSRHFMDKEFVKRYIDLLALHKMNRFHWHLTDDQGWRIEIKKYPLLTQKGAWRKDGKGGKYGGFYSQDDIREIVAYAGRRGVMIVPEIEMPGHAQAALAAYPQHSCTAGPFDVETEWGVFKEIYCAGNDSTYTFIENILSEVIALFPSPYIHIGGDEVPKFRWGKCPKCQKRIKEQRLVDGNGLQSYFIGRINSFLKSKGKQLIGWDEIMEGGLVEGAIVQSWRGFDAAEKAAKSGHATIVSPTSHAYFDYGLNEIDLQKVYEFDPIPKGLSKKEKKLVLGAECNMWSERAPQEKIDSKVFPRILAMSELLWSNPKKKDFVDFKDRVSKHYSILDKLDVNYGMENIPVSIATKAADDKLLVELQNRDSSLTAEYSFGKSVWKTYSKPFEITEKDSLKIKFRRGQKEIDFSINQLLNPHLGVGKRIWHNYKISEQYAADIIDGKRGSTNFKDGNWQGTFGYDINVVIDLGKLTDIKALGAGFLQYNNAWIFFPKKVDFLVSSDGKNYISVGQAFTKIDARDKREMTQEFSIAVNRKIRYINVKGYSIGRCPDWHDAAGSPSWIFLDEVWVEGKKEN
jgi:hexosaminidase